MSAVVWAEAGCGRAGPRVRGDRDAAHCYGQLRRLVGDVAAGREREARRRIRFAAAFLDPIGGGTRWPDPCTRLPTCRLPSLSIVIPSHCRADLLRLCLASVTRFAPPHTEVIVVDDGSPGGFVSRTPRRSRSPSDPPREARGFCAAANAGIAAATAPVVELLNDDAEVTAGWADAALAWFADDRVAAVAPLVLQNDPARRARGLAAADRHRRRRIRPRRLRAKRGTAWLRRHDASFPEKCLRRVGLRRVLPPRAVLARAAFPKHFGPTSRTWIFPSASGGSGLRSSYDPGSVVWHRVSSSYGKRPSRRVLEQQSCNEERVFWRNTRGTDRLRIACRATPASWRPRR